MRKLLSGLSLVAVAGALAVVMGCASPAPVGVLYTEITLPAIATSNAQATKVGVSECTSILALVAMGDASIDAAAKNGGITKIHSVDWEAKSILGIYGTYRTIVRGE
ncbi:MAG: TRL-like family protein [Verrucomicrobia bacterium]|nr:TRL-like family protein [Verrucomicrobiota bacterium]MCG2678971.1 TRL-like family protein [Kiritimatiellia bacterium]MBU4247627.1 TRL-like family protein [Verrucomicrobiota bacterium]MBU4290808.1 TRL-like family protein [Verrucomicrobiota bacterium]MBU4428354.1 TRL-like family protein [Verrucomicrobiota bacterium]